MPNPIYIYIYIKYIEFGLVGFFGISAIVGFLMPNQVYAYILDIYDMSLTIQLNISHFFTIPSQSGPGSDGNERVFLIPQNLSSTGPSPSDCLVYTDKEY